MSRIPPGADDRARYLATLKKADLAAEVALLEEELAAAPAAPALPGIPMVLHVGGAPWNGTERRLIRVAPRGELSELWIAAVGDQMLLASGQGIPLRAYRHTSPSLQGKIAHSMDDALRLLE